jgi:predicted metal-binding membrane protein
MFAVGVMNVVWMVVLGAVMTIEKMLTGRRFTHMIGLLLIAAGIGIVISAFVSHWPV